MIPIEYVAFLAYKKKSPYCEQDLEKYSYFDADFDSKDLFSAGGEAVSIFD